VQLPWTIADNTHTDVVSLNSPIIVTEVINNNIITSQTAYVWTGLHFMAGHWFWVSCDDLQYKVSLCSEEELPEICAVELWIEKRGFRNTQTVRNST